MPTLSDAEIEAVTHYRRPSMQAKALEAMGIAFKRRPDGSVLLTAEAVQQALRAQAPATAAVDEGFNWSKT